MQKTHNYVGVDKAFRDKLDEVVLEVGKVVFSRQEMIAHLGCANFTAARTLTKELRKLSITSAARLYRTDPMSLARIRHVGMATIYVAMCFLDYSGYNVAKWWGWKSDNVVKFSTFKHKALVRAKRRAA